MNDPAAVAHELDCIVGVVEHGIFLNLATEVFVGGPGGVALLKRKNASKPTRRAKRKKPATKTKSQRR